MKILEQSAFKNLKREKLLDFRTYETNFLESSYTFDIVKQSLEQPATVLEAIAPYDLMVPTKQRAWDAIDHLANCYSAGHDIADLACLYPSVLEYWEVYAKFSKVFKEADTLAPSTVAHLALQGNDFVFANRLVCMGILLGWGKLLPRILPIIDYNNPVRDGLLERLLSFYVSDRGTPPDDCTRHLPYFKTIKIFAANASDRPGLLADYLAEWYHASRREPYFDSHKKGSSFLGYWSWEAAAIAFVLDIDDSGVRDAQFYPIDLIAYANDFANVHPQDQLSASVELRAKAGDSCPRAGRWKTLDIPVQTASYTEGEIMGGSLAPYGLTVWTYADDI